MKVALVQTSLIWENPIENRSHLSQKINGFMEEVKKNKEEDLKKDNKQEKVKKTFYFEYNLLTEQLLYSEI